MEVDIKRARGGPRVGLMSEEGRERGRERKKRE